MSYVEPPLRDLLTRFALSYHRLCRDGADHGPEVEAAEAAIWERFIAHLEQVCGLIERGEYGQAQDYCQAAAQGWAHGMAYRAADSGRDAKK
jgi:hypothetical protein